MEVSGQLHVPAALPPRKEPFIWIGGWVGPRSGRGFFLYSPMLCPTECINKDLGNIYNIPGPNWAIEQKTETRRNVQPICKITWNMWLLL